MRRWFLSYNSQDLALMERLEAALKLKDPTAKIFFAPKSLRAGGYWLPQLAEAIAQATAFVLLVGEKGLGPWQIDEYYEARDRRVPVLLLLVEGQPAPGLPFLRTLHWIVTSDPASEQSVARLFEGASGKGPLTGELWRYTAPYRGLSAMTETDSDFFFGRIDKTIEVIQALATAPDRLPILLGNSGVGKSSLAQAGVLAALMRQDWPERAESVGPWPPALSNSRRWCLLKLSPGVEPVRAMVEPFLRTWQFDAVDPRRAELLTIWVSKLLDGAVSLRDLLDATEARYRDELKQEKPPAFLIYVDQGEELYVRGQAHQRARFSEILSAGLSDPRLRAMMSLRADFFGELQKDEPLYAVHRLISVPPLRQAELLEVVSRPAELLSAQFETGRLPGNIAQQTAEESTQDAGALPLLSYLLDDMWAQMVHRGDGILRLPSQAIELGAVLVDRADAFLAANPNSEQLLRRVFTLKLATLRENEEPTRRRAFRSEFSEEEWRLICDLANHPNRLLATATPEAGEAYAEVAHEAIFRRWDKLRDWITGEREFLIWKGGLEHARRAWQAAPEDSRHGALLMGLSLRNAQSWMAKRLQDMPAVDRAFIVQSTKAEQRQKLRVRGALGAAALVIGAVFLVWLNQASLLELWTWFAVIRPYQTSEVRPFVLSPQAERALKPKDSFRECAKNCPEMVVIGSGQFMMGSPANEIGRYDNEGDDQKRQHNVVLSRAFAVGKFVVTFDDWDACVSYGDCDPRVSDSGWGHGRQPVINVAWDDARTYVKWLSRMTGKNYRLLSEAEWEYAARGGTLTPYPWGEAIGNGNADCNGCGSRWDNKQPAPVGSFGPNSFGLYDTNGDVWEWVEDCYHQNYTGAPTDGSAWSSPVCKSHVARAGSCFSIPRRLRSAVRNGYDTEYRGNDQGFRVARTLAP